MVELPACSDRCWVPMTSALGKAKPWGTPSPFGSETNVIFSAHMQFFTSFLLRISVRQARGSTRQKQAPREVCDPVGRWEPWGTQAGQGTQSSGFSCFLQNILQGCVGRLGTNAWKEVISTGRWDLSVLGRKRRRRCAWNENGRKGREASQGQHRKQESGFCAYTDLKEACILPKSSLLARNTQKTGYPGLFPSFPSLGFCDLFPWPLEIYYKYQVLSSRCILISPNHPF